MKMKREGAKCNMEDLYDKVTHKGFILLPLGCFAFRAICQMFSNSLIYGTASKRP